MGNKKPRQCRKCRLLILWPFPIPGFLYPETCFLVDYPTTILVFVAMLTAAAFAGKPLDLEVSFCEVQFHSLTSDYRADIPGSHPALFGFYKLL